MLDSTRAASRASNRSCSGGVEEVCDPFEMSGAEKKKKKTWNWETEPNIHHGEAISVFAFYLWLCN